MTKTMYLRRHLDSGYFSTLYSYAKRLGFGKTLFFMNSRVRGIVIRDLTPERANEIYKLCWEEFYSVNVNSYQNWTSSNIREALHVILDFFDIPYPDTSKWEKPQIRKMQHFDKVYKAISEDKDIICLTQEALDIFKKRGLISRLFEIIEQQCGTGVLINSKRFYPHLSQAAKGKVLIRWKDMAFIRKSIEAMPPKTETRGCHGLSPLQLLELLEQAFERKRSTKKNRLSEV